MRVDMTTPDLAATDMTWTVGSPIRRDRFAHLDVDGTGWHGEGPPLVQIDTPKDAHAWVRLELSPHDARRLAAAILTAANQADGLDLDFRIAFAPRTPGMDAPDDSPRMEA